MSEPSRRKGKKLFPSQFNNSYNKYHPMFIEAIQESPVYQSPKQDQINYQQIGSIANQNEYFPNSEANGIIAKENDIHAKYNENQNNLIDNIQRNGTDIRLTNQRPPRDPRSQIQNTEKLPQIDPTNNLNYDTLGYDAEIQLGKGKRSSSLSKLGEQNYKQMIDVPIPKYPQQAQHHYEDPMQSNTNAYNGLDEEEQALREEYARQEQFRTLGTPNRSRQAIHQYQLNNNIEQLPEIPIKQYSNSVDRLHDSTIPNEELTAGKVPMLNFEFRKIRSQGIPGLNLNGLSNPITHNQMPPSSFTNSGNLWYHQREEKDIAKRRQKILCDALNEQRRLEKQRKEIDKQFETIHNYKLQMAMNEQIAKEDQLREGYRKRLEDASKLNDARLGYYLDNYYLPPEEKDLRTSNSERMKSGSGNQRKIKMMKKRRVGE